MFIVGNTNKKGQIDEIFYQSGSYMTGDPSDVDIIDYLITNYGGGVGDYAIIHIDEKSDKYKKIKKEKAKYELEWVSDGVADIDFSEYDTWNVLKVTADKEIINPDEIATLTFTVYESDGITVDANYKKNIDIDTAKKSTEKIATKVKFKDGVGVLEFSAINPGMYKFPFSEWNDKKNDLRVSEQATVNVRLVF